MTAVLYDAPGPRAKRRNLLLGVVGVAALLAVAGFVVYRFAVTGQFEPDIWQWILYKNIQLLLFDALLNTLRALAVAAVLALVFGAVFAAGRLSDHRWLSGPATCSKSAKSIVYEDAVSSESTCSLNVVPAG